MDLVIYKDKAVELKLGQRVSFKAPETSSKFYNSSLGEKMKAGICDECVLTAKRHDWLEVYFEISLHKNGEPISNSDFYQDDCDDDKPYIENGDYHFLRYLLSNGAEIQTSR